MSYMEFFRPRWDDEFGSRAEEPGAGGERTAAAGDSGFVLRAVRGVGGGMRGIRGHKWLKDGQGNLDKAKRILGYKAQQVVGGFLQTENMKEARS